MVIDEEKKLILWNQFKNSIRNFALYFFPHLLFKKSAEFHEQMYEDLTARHSFLAYEVFRGGAKSTIGLIIKPIHFSLFDKIGDISLISRSEEFVLNEITRKIKFEFENNEDLNLFFGDLRTPKWSESYFVLRNGIAFEGKGIGGQLRGGRRGLICLDDLEDEETASSEEQRDKLKRRIGKELIPKLLPNGQMIYFGTPVHLLSYLHQLIQTPNNGWIKRIIPGYIDRIQEKGKEAWPEMFPHERLQQIKQAMGSNYFAGEILCNPIADENVAIKEGMLRYWTEMPKQYSCVITVDPAYSEDETSDYKVASVIAIDPQMNRYLLQYIRTHTPVGEFIDGVLNLYLRYKDRLTKMGVPSGGTEKEFYRSLVNKAIERKMFGVPFVELKNVYTTATGEAKRNKGARIIAALQPLFEKGKYYIAPYHIEAREELLCITPHSLPRWDDIIDTMASAEQILSQVYFDTPGFEEQQPVDLEKMRRERGFTGYGDY